MEEEWIEEEKRRGGLRGDGAVEGSRGREWEEKRKGKLQLGYKINE